MTRGRRKGLLIAGGGFAGALAALAMARLRPDVPLLLVEEQARFGGGAGGLLHLGDRLAPAARDLLAPLVTQAWDGYFTAFPGGSRKRRAAIAEARSEQLHAEIVRTLRADQYRLNARVVAVREDSILLHGGEELRAEGAIDARGAANLSLLDHGWRVETRVALDLDAPHGLDRPVLVDATVAGRFHGVTPEGPARLILSDWDFGPAAEPDPEAPARLAAYAARRGWTGRPGAAATRARPVPTGGDFGGFWRIGGARVAKLGMRGGFFHPVTGWTLADAADTALLLAAQRDFTGAALHDAFAAEAAARWKRRAPLRAVGAALLAADHDGRRAMLERVFGLGGGTLAAFLTGDPGLIDRRRLAGAVKG